MRRLTKLFYARASAILCLLMVAVMYARQASLPERHVSSGRQLELAAKSREDFFLRKGLLPLGPVVDHVNDTSTANTWSSATSTGPDCPGISRPRVREGDAWQGTAVDAGLYVFSAYLDRRVTKHGDVKVIAVQERQQANVSLWCQLWKGSQLRVVKASRAWLPEVSVKRYAGIIITCQLFLAYEPEIVSITLDRSACDDGTNAIGVHNLALRTVHAYDFAVCLSTVITDKLDDTRKLVEWMEAQEMFGADHIVLYHKSLSPELRTIIDYYKGRRQILSVVDWSLPVDAGEIHELGKLSLLSDCLYRTMYTSQNALFLDLNDFIVPRSNFSFSWYDVMRSRDCVAQPQVLVQQVSFDAGVSNDEAASGDGSDLMTLTKTSRAKSIAAHRDGSRYMVRPEQIGVPGLFKVHHFLKKTSRSQTCYISPKEALTHTYVIPSSKKPLKTTVIDRTFQRFQKSIVSKVELVYKDVRHL